MLYIEKYFVVLINSKQLPIASRYILPNILLRKGVIHRKIILRCAY